MKRFFIAAGLSGGLLLVALNASAHPGEHKEAESGKAVTIKGELIDSACYVASDGDAKGKDHADCASKCLGTGIPAAILPEGSKAATDIMYLLTNPKPLAQYAGRTIQVEGTSHPGMRAIDVKKIHVIEADGKKTEVKLDDEHHNMAGGGEKKDDGHKDHKH